MQYKTHVGEKRHVPVHRLNPGAADNDTGGGRRHGAALENEGQSYTVA